jgi:branched-chain amino acid transport system permease protein
MALVLAKVLPVVVIGGLNSFGGALVAAALVGVAESLAAGYLDPMLGAGFSGVVAASLVIVMLCIRPNGLFGAAPVARV